MKKILLLFLCIGIAVCLQAQSISSYMERQWHGYYKEPSTLFTDGEYTMAYTMYNVDYDDYTNTFTATMSGTINIEGTTYGTTWKIDGSVSPDNYYVHLNYSYTISGDVLPDGLYWIYNNLEGTLYEDIDYQNEYIIHGSNPSTSADYELVTQ